MMCQCEHGDHFDSPDVHEFGAEVEEVKEVRTLYGTYFMCPECIHQHLPPNAAVVDV